MVHSIHVSRHAVYWMQTQVGFGRVYFPGPDRVGARAHFLRWAQPILRLSRRACARANDGLASVNAGQPLMKNLSHFVKSVLYQGLCEVAFNPFSAGTVFKIPGSCGKVVLCIYIAIFVNVVRRYNHSY